MPFPCRLLVEADPCPQALLRVLGLVAQQMLEPAKLTADREGGCWRLEIAFDDLPEPKAELLLAKTEAIVAVHRARLVVPTP
ncbi:hypothetical protein [Sphingomonas sp.]|uniref:hypothetical protein n=1 Tax=Sphingomonas sp. TaxID=28214 RepID=UPI001B2F6299|nr:hypothetical protein [Sphingomonas sp.]MBO9711625.1 hypothetical protein [Sphingomonas sp.]